MKKKSVVLFASVVWIGISAVPGADKTRQIIDLGAGTEMLAINERGEIVFTGLNTNGSVQQAVLWQDGTATRLGILPDDTASWASDLNNRGQVVGWSTGTCFSRAFLWQEGVITPLGGCATKATSINDRGTISGWSWSPSTGARAVMWQDGNMVDLGVPPSSFGSAAYSINKHGQIVGQYGVAGYSHAFLWDNGRVTDLGLIPGATACGAQDINDRGQIVGWCFMSTGFTRAFLWQEGVMTALHQTSGILGSSAGSINNHGLIVGSGYGSDYQARALMWDAGAMIDLASAIAPSQWTVLAAYSVNNRGQIVGLGYTTLQDYHWQGFLLNFR